jgi:tRNA threonylcarbamoyladenosine biosynthesis protein TsaE
MSEVFVSHSVEETERLGENVAKSAKRGDIFLLHGDLGAGKTHFVRGFARFFGVPEAEIHSPTYSIINEYPGNTPIFHMDLYRIKSERELFNIGVEDYLNRPGICVIEWPDRAPNLWPPESVNITISTTSETSRKIRISNPKIA